VKVSIAEYDHRCFEEAPTDSIDVFVGIALN